VNRQHALAWRWSVISDLGIRELALPSVTTFAEATLPLVVELGEAFLQACVLLDELLLQLIEKQLGVKIHGAQGTLKWQFAEIELRGRRITRSGSNTSHNKSIAETPKEHESDTRMLAAG